MGEPEYSVAGSDSEDIAALGIPPARAGGVLVVSGAPVTATVVSRIVEMTGLKCTVQSPFEAEQASHLPALAAVIVDEDTELAARISGKLQSSAGRRALVLLLATGGPILEAARRSPHVDAVIAKPITAVCLQPLLFNLRQFGDEPG